MTDKAALKERGRSNKRKGKTFEREIANQFRAVFPNAKRGIGQARSSKEVSDVDGTPFWIECKFRKQVVISSALAQAENDTDGRLPIVVWRKIGTRATHVTMRLAVLATLEEYAAFAWAGNARPLPNWQPRGLPEFERIPVQMELSAFLSLAALACAKRARGFKEFAAHAPSTSTAEIS